jgi:hypothetical protein
MEGFTSLSEERDRLQERSLQRQVAADAAAKHQQHTASARAAREKRESEALAVDLQKTNARLRKRIKSLKQSLRSSAATAKKLGALQRERTPFELCACGNPGAQGAEGGDVPSCPQAERQPLRPPPQSKELPFLRSRVEALEVGVQDDHRCCLAPNVGRSAAELLVAFLPPCQACFTNATTRPAPTKLGSLRHHIRCHVASCIAAVLCRCGGVS